MIMRLVMPTEYTSQDELRALVGTQISSVLNSEALRNVLSLLHSDIGSLKRQYDARIRKDGSVRELQEIGADESLEKLRYALYPLLAELGFFAINKPVTADYNRIIVLGGTLNACNGRVLCARRFVSESVTRVDALTAFRPINPIERTQSLYASHSDTEFGVMSDAFVNHFSLQGMGYADDFKSNRNLNEVACVRQFTNAPDRIAYTIYASPSLQPDLRRANTGDCITDYISNNTFSKSDRLLFISHNRYCNRQFIQILTCMLKTSVIVPFDIIGYVDDSDVDTADTYNMPYDLQELIALTDWMQAFLYNDVTGAKENVYD